MSSFFNRIFARVFGYEEEHISAHFYRPTSRELAVSAKQEQALASLRASTKKLKNGRKKFDTLSDIRISVEKARDKMPDFQDDKK